MRFRTLLEHVGQTVPVPSTFMLSMVKRLECEGVAAFSRLTTQSYKLCLASLCQTGSINVDTPFGRLDVDGIPFRVLDLLGLGMKMDVEGVTVQPDYAAFESRSKETAAFAGCSYENFLPVPRVFRRYLEKMLGEPPKYVCGRHGPGATAEKLRGWDKYLALSTPFSEWTPIRMVDVPKDASKRRLIGIEPAHRQFVQQGLARALRRTPMFRSHIKISDQFLHARKALAGLQSRGVVTVDLSDASDHLSPSLVEWLLPAWYETLARFTANTASTPSGAAISLGMMATMGCGFCFELETLIFHIVAALCVHYETGSPPSECFQRCSCYGDDLVLPSIAYGAFGSVAYKMGWIVNEGKTSITPQFLETCGYYITPTSIRRRITPSLKVTGCGELILDYAQSVSLSRLLRQCLYDAASDAIDEHTKGFVLDCRWNKKLSLLQVKLLTAVPNKRPLSVTDNIRYRAYWESRVSGQESEDTGTNRLKATWASPSY